MYSEGMTDHGFGRWILVIIDEHRNYSPTPREFNLSISRWLVFVFVHDDSSKGASGLTPTWLVRGSAWSVATNHPFSTLFRWFTG